MVNEGIFGLQETITPEIQGDKVLVRRRLVRHNGSAAIPPGQSVEFEFYVAQFPFGVSIQNSGPAITTSERSITPQMGISELPAPVAPKPAVVVPIVADRPAPSRGAGPFGAVGAPFRSVSPSDGRSAPSAEAGSPAAAPAGAAILPAGTGADPSGAGTAGAIARMRGLDSTLFGDLLGGGGVIFDPPPPAPDPVIPFEVTLTPPNGLAPMVFTNPRASQLRQIPTDVAMARVDPVFLDKGRGLWKVSVRNVNAEARRMTVAVTSNHALAPLQQQQLPLSLLNHLMASVLKKSVPTLAFDNGSFFVQTPTHFLGLLGVEAEASIGGAVASLIDSLPTFSPITAAIESRSALVTRIIERREALRLEYDRQIAEIVGTGQAANLRRSALVARRNRAIDACDSSIRRLTGLAPANAVFCIVVEGMFSDAPISLDYVGTVARIDNKLPQIALVFDERMRLSEVVSNIAVDLSPALAKVVLGTAALVALSAVALSGIFVPLGIGLAIFGGYKLYNSIDDLDVEERIRLAIKAKGPAIGHYVRSAFERISAIGASALRCELLPNGAADGKDALRIHYYDPATAIPPRPRRPAEGVAAPAFDTVLVASGETARRAPSAVTVARPRGRARAVEQRIGLAREAPGQLPEGFRVERPETLPLLDRHDAIVVLMMENRSFDHFFHDLADTFPGRGYTRVPPDFTNAAPPGFGAPFGVTRNADIGIGNSLIFGRGNDVSSLDPHHNYEHTRFQIGGGTEDSLDTGEMNGFARDFARVSDSPQIAMSYYGLDSLPVYRALADHYPVCDNWFAALPVGTYPNRLSMLQGNVPFLHNIHADDPAIGYLEDYSIFDLLDTQGIPWRFFESDLGTIRLYDRYRLDVANVRPISELEQTLRTGRDTGRLPRVMFVEPEFLFGNDDHPPMNIQDGQDFIRQVIGKFIDFGLLDRVMFLITYDEHGGFFDHVPPPGTARGPAEWIGQVAGLFPQDPEREPKSLGVRVPSLLLSKFASRDAKHQVLDHSAILKTILLHNRSQVSTAQFSRFGERVKRCAHFGELLDLPVPRQMDYAAIAQAMGYRSETSWFGVRPTIVEGRVARLSPGHPARVLRGIAQPRAKRLVGG